MCWPVGKLIQNEGKILVLGIKCSKKEFSMCYLVNNPAGKVSSIEFECILRMAMKTEERQALMI